MMDAVPAEATPSPNALRRTLSLDGAWRFRHEDGAWRTATVPGPWQAEFPDLVEAGGRAVYQRDFDLPAGWGGRTLALKFGAVGHTCTVLLNGRPIGGHEGAYLPFEIEVPPGLIAARNTVEVRVSVPLADDAEAPFGEVPHGKMSWYGRIGGLWQSVTLEERDARRVTGIAIAAGADGRADIVLDFSPAAAGLATTLAVTDPAGAVVATADCIAAASAVVAMHVPDARPWSPESPTLYRLTVTLADADAVAETFGFRTIETRDGRILLNGRPIYLRGALDQDYYPDGIYTPPSLAFLEDQARKAKHLGLNLLRCHIKVPDPRYYEVADRLGLLVWTEIPNVAEFSEAAASRLRQTLHGMLARDRNHPSIIAWTLVNEDWGTRLVENAEHRRWLKETYDWLKAADPTRLVVDNSPCFPNFHVKTDLNDYHYYRSVPERRQEWDDITAQFATGPAWTYSPFGDAERRGGEPLVVSEFGVWGLPDPARLRRPDGSEPSWFDSGWAWGGGVALPHGVERRFAALDLGRTFGSFDAFVAAAQWYQFANLRYQIETIRLHAPIMGYVITELTDVHWEANGLLDLARNPRVFHDVFASINADIVIVPRPARYAVHAGETVEVIVTVASGGAGVPEGARLRWSGDAAGSLAVAPVGAVATSPPHVVRVAFAEAGGNRMARIDFVLERDGAVLARNSCDIAVYGQRATAGLPSVAAADGDLADHARGLGYRVVPAGEADVVLAHALDAADIERLNAGARYVVLADGSAATNGNLRTDMAAGERPHREIVADGRKLRPSYEQYVPGIGLQPRDGTIWRGDWIAGFSWLSRAGAFAGIPGGPLLDLSFSDVVPHHVLTGFRPWEYGGNVLAGIVVGWVHQPAAFIAHRRVGRGSVVATTFRLTRQPPGADPVAANLFDALVREACGGKGG